MDDWNHADCSSQAWHQDQMQWTMREVETSTSHATEYSRQHDAQHTESGGFLNWLRGLFS